MRAKQITNCILMLVFALLSEVSVVIADEVPQGQILNPPEVHDSHWYSPEDLNDYKGKANDLPGVYEIQLDGYPIYVGRSRVSVNRRLWAHAGLRGSRCVAAQILEGRLLTYQWIHTESPEQLEAQILNKDRPPCNMRGERDPAD